MCKCVTVHANPCLYLTQKFARHFSVGYSLAGRWCGLVVFACRQNKRCRGLSIFETSLATTVVYWAIFLMGSRHDMIMECLPENSFTGFQLLGLFFIVLSFFFCRQSPKLPLFFKCYTYCAFVSMTVRRQGIKQVLSVITSVCIRLHYHTAMFTF